METGCLRCGRKVYARGLCEADYKTFRMLVKRGLITDEQAVASGRVLASKAGVGISSAGPAQRWFLDATAAASADDAVPPPVPKLRRA